MAKVVSDDDLKAAEEELTTRLKDEAVSEYSDENLIVVPEGSKVEVLEYQPSPAKGEEAEKFKLALKLKLTFLAFDEDDMLAVAEDDIHEVLPEDKFLLGGSETSISYDLANEDIDNGKLDVFYHASKSFARSLDREVVKEEMAGLSAGEIEAELSKKDSVESVTVDFWPFWVKSAPTNTKRIFVDISLN